VSVSGYQLPPIRQSSKYGAMLANTLRINPISPREIRRSVRTYASVSGLTCVEFEDWRAGMCTRPPKPRPKRDPRPMSPRPRQDRDVQNFVRDETETRCCSFRDAGRDLEALETFETRELQRLAETFYVTYGETH